MLLTIPVVIVDVVSALLLILLVLLHSGRGGGLSDMFGLSTEGDQQMGLRFERNEALSARDRVPEVVTLGLGSAPAGRYHLELIVTDRISGQVTRTQRQFHIRGQ